MAKALSPPDPSAGPAYSEAERIDFHCQTCGDRASWKVKATYKGLHSRSNVPVQRTHYFCDIHLPLKARPKNGG